MRALSRRSSASPRSRCATSCRSSGSSTPPAPGSPTRSTCSQGAEERGASSTTRSRCPGKVPQICCLFGPSAAGGAYIPSFCDIVVMVEGNASMYLGSPRMAEMVVGEKVTLEEMGGARMHATVSGCGDNLARDDAEAIDLAKAYFSYVPSSWRGRPPDLRCRSRPQPPLRPTWCRRRRTPATTSTRVIDALVDEGSFFEVKPLFAAELVVGFGLLGGTAGRHRRQQPGRTRWRALRRLRRQGGAVHLGLRRVQRAARLPRPTCPAS